MQFTYRGLDFYLDGEKFIIRSGAMHYFRTPKYYWYDRLLKLKECGFNTLETYVAWNIHEPQEGVYRFDADADLACFLDMAKDLGLFVILRPGPYICAEWEAGGFPAWLMTYENMRLRCNDELYFSKLERWTRKLMEIVVPRLITSGGNILMVQVENEYGSHGNDGAYLCRLRDLYIECGVNTLLFTCDGPEDGLLESGKIDGCLTFLNFGSDTKTNMEILAKKCPNQPLMCTEFWCGWFDNWREAHHVRTSQSICNAFEPFLENGYSFNFYMFHGGTNFGFMNGASNHKKCNYVVTSYDYNALLTEAGDRTAQYYGVRNLMQKYGVDVPTLTATESKKRAYGEVRFTHSAKLFENVDVIGEKIVSPFPKRMEELGQSYGYIVYDSKLPKALKDYEIYLDGLADRAIVYIDGEKVGTVEKGRDFTPIRFTTTDKCKKLRILVENMGRANYGPFLMDRKGLSGVRLCWEYMNKNLMCFENIPLPMDNLDKLRYSDGEIKPFETPAFYKGEIIVDEPCDTFLKPYGFSKGFVVINGVNIGRYFNEAGPQKTLYVPACYLKKGKNEIVVFDSDGANAIKATFVDAPEL